jgi:hypothetical protein
MEYAAQILAEFGAGEIGKNDSRKDAKLAKKEGENKLLAFFAACSKPNL